MGIPATLVSGQFGILLTLALVGVAGICYLRQRLLTRAFQRKFDVLQRANEDLKDEFDRRTAELSQVNARLVQEIAERKQAEQALWMAQFSLDKTADGVTWMTPDGRQVYVNDAACRMPGFAREELLALTVFDLDPNLSTAEWQRRWQHYKQHGSTMSERQYHRRDGSAFPVEVTMTHLEFQGNEYLCSFFRDISERKRSEAALRASEEHHRTVVERGNDGITIIKDAVIEYINPQMAAMLGYMPDDIRYMPFDRFITVADRAMVQEYYHHRVVGKPSPNRYEVNLLHREGYSVAVEISASVIEYQSRPAVLGFVRDITERKRAEEALRKSQKLIQSILDNSPAAISVKDTEGRYLFANHRLGSIVHDDPATVIGKVAYDVLPPECSVIARVSDQQVITTGKPSSEERVIHHDDGPHIYLETKFPLYDTYGAIYAVGCIATDITEYKQAEGRLLQQARGLSMLRERERLARDLHDDLGQVLGYINTQAQAVREALVQSKLTLAEQHLTELVAVVQDRQLTIREFILGVKVSPAAEQGFIPTLRQYLERFGQMHRLQTAFAAPPELEEIVLGPAVEVHLLGIVQEALHNVRKHAAARLITLSLDQQDNQMQVVMADDGKGFSLAAVQPDEEHGYGLHSMQGRAGEIRGSLQIETAPGQGTRVIVRVPLQPPEEYMHYSHSLRILLVDDNTLFAYGLRNLLMVRGFPVVGIAHNGLEAVEKARTLQPDMILMDIEMPVCDGLKATRLLKAEFPNIQIVMLTISEDDDHLFEAIKSGAAGYLLKNLDSDELCELLSGIAYDEPPLSPGLATRILREFAAQDSRMMHMGAPHNGKQLTPHEVEVLTLVAQGYTYQEVGKALNFSERAIKYHMAGIIQRLQVKNRTEAIAYALQKMERGEWNQRVPE